MAHFLSFCRGSKPEVLLQINILMLNLLLLGFKAQEIEDYYWHKKLNLPKRRAKQNFRGCLPTAVLSLKNHPWAQKLFMVQQYKFTFWSFRITLRGLEVICLSPFSQAPWEPGQGLVFHSRNTRHFSDPNKRLTVSSSLTTWIEMKDVQMLSASSMSSTLSLTPSLFH